MPDTTTDAAIDAAAHWLHDDECDDGKTCGRWRAGSDPRDRAHPFYARHVQYYRDRASAILRAAAAGGDSLPGTVRSQVEEARGVLAGWDDERARWTGHLIGRESALAGQIRSLLSVIDAVAPEEGGHG